MIKNQNNILSGFNGFLKTHSLKIFMGLIFAVIWYNDQRYESKVSAEEKSVEIQQLNMNFLLHEQVNRLKLQALEKELSILKERFSKKIKIQNEQSKEIDDNENELIRLETILQTKK